MEVGLTLAENGDKTVSLKTTGTSIQYTVLLGVRMWGDVHGFDYNQQDRLVFYKRKCNFRLALMNFKKFLLFIPH